MKRKSVLALNSILIIALALMIGYTPTQASAPSRPRLAPSDSLDWYDGDWTYRVPVDILSPCGVEEIDYQVQITLDSSFDFSHALSDGSDIRVTDSDGITLIPFWIELWDSGTQAASIWIKVPVIPDDGTTVYIYYGNPTPPAIPTPDPVETPPIGPWVKEAGNPIIPAGDPGDDGISLLAENMVYDDVTEHYWLVFADYSQGGVGLAWSDCQRSQQMINGRRNCLRSWWTLYHRSNPCTNSLRSLGGISC